MSIQALTKDFPGVPDPVDDGCLELSDEDLRAMVDANAREYLSMSGEELLHRLRERKPLTDDTGHTVPAWEPVTMLARLLLLVPLALEKIAGENYANKFSSSVTSSICPRSR